MRPESLSVSVGGQSIAEFCGVSVSRSLESIRNLSLTGREEQIASRVVDEIRTRLEFLEAVGLEYLSLDRSAAGEVGDFVAACPANEASSDSRS